MTDQSPAATATAFLEAFGSGDLHAMLAPLDRDVVDGSLVVRWISAPGRISVGARWASVATGYATWRSSPLADDLPIKRRRRMQ